MDASESSASKIFVDSSGRPFSVFIVDLETIPEGEGLKLVRQLKKHGAVISSSPQEANFILATQLPNFDRNPDQSVLDPSWIVKCIEGGRLLLEKDDWGGCAIQDSGFSDVDSDERPSLPPRHMRQRPSVEPRSASQNATDLAASVHSFSSHTPDSSREHTAEPTLDQYSTSPQQNLRPFMPGSPTDQTSVPSPYGQIPGPLMLGPPMQAPFNPQLVAQMMSNQVQRQNFLMALADVYRVNMEAQAQTGNTSPATFASNAAYHHSLPMPHVPAFSVKDEKPASRPLLKDEEKPTLPHSPDKGKRRATSPTPDVPASPAQIFIRKGASIMFYVQVDMSQRHDLVSKIKKHGGTIATDHHSADYAILSQRSKMFSTLFRMATASKTPVITASFVQDSIEQGKLLPLISKYLVEAPQKIMPKQRQDDLVHMKETNSKVQALETQAKASRSRKPTVRMEKEQKAAKQRLVSVTNETPTINRPPSPPLPPPHAKVMMSSGKYTYTPLERDFIAAYAKVLCERDIQMGHAAMAEKFHQKMPHHSAHSFRTMLSGQLKEVIELARKRAAIANRKNMYNAEKAAQQQEQQHPAPSDTNGRSVKRQKLSEENSNERDLQLAAQFFADGGADGIDDDDDNRSVLWARLHDKGDWRSPSSWETFYNTFHIEIKRRFGEITGQGVDD